MKIIVTDCSKKAYDYFVGNMKYQMNFKVCSNKQEWSYCPARIANDYDGVCTDCKYKETFEIEYQPPKRWRACEKGEYWYVESNGSVCLGYEDNLNINDERWNLGNYFISCKEAEDSKFYRVFHEED